MTNFNIDLLSLRLFVRVIEEGTISRAAQFEHITPAAVSRRIAELEAQFNTALLMRSNKGVQPTPAGVELLYQAKSLFSQVNSLKEQLQFYADNKNQTIRMIANASAIVQFLVHKLGEFLLENPNIQLTLEEKSSSKIIQNLEEGQADIGVFTLLPHAANIETIPLKHDRLVLLVHRSHPLASKHAVSFLQTLDYEHISLLPGSQLNYQITKAAEGNGHLRLACQVSSYDSMCLLINSGVGIGILPRESVRMENLPQVVIVELEEDWVERTLVIGTRSMAYQTQSIRLLIDFLLERGQGGAH